MTGEVTIACIGAGRMGRGIAQCVAYAGHAVRLIDAKERDADAFAKLRDEALDEIRTALASIAALGAFRVDAVPQIMDRVSIVPRGEAAAGLAGARIVFEGVPEVTDAKRDAFALFDAHADGDAILASTTSTMLSTELAGFTSAPERFLNAHWLNPAFLMPLVELSPADETDTETTAFVRAYLEGIGKVPIVCKASPGYIVPRIQALAMNEAARIVEEGVASAEDVDKAVTYGFGLRFGVLGLLEFIDWGGGDILYYASRYLAGAFDDERYAAPGIISRNMEEGRIGLKTGSGFFDYADVDVDAYRQRRMAAFLKALDNAGLVRPPVL
ncbi:3-hydroxybutyryl-CoA dehydrogenase [Nitratireductor aquimarinus]|uniref:3-hydroxybutyryl-CoA dehydrogenase n=1 Tax=Nitratireductor TaxID=245876 RepID=UPI0019D3687E|nr:MULTISPECIES: 3-hydroxybutyryl-CoA dehydrogenase [Nitratireductor]MBN7777424.1 3-hydroxybutyryl-CoA dehydrogenase [Nitratireductor pacificus]MBN7781095.1 3-hydroxybutyryl-CoA dehydrogenase [Nitratireductor pacificus]MBN7789901.1 3-hydroxybutyryl-CoA dehydrogenase [Nitratireductor aquimarinus]MBY6099633.1 3-hydroxybutyryl-CoA dehydrogenase [Nitratireductor aquimarinus]MCA1261393.1 3-hydroxybutyryl-CoA dehydrogenase [Nitratireductor aquimarinus]